MAIIEVKTKMGKDKDSRQTATPYDFGNDLASASKMHGEKEVYDIYVRGGKVDLQAFVRRLQKAGKTDKEILAGVAKEWKPGVKAARGKSSLEKATDAFGKLSAEEKAALKKKLGL
jgi:hypothetical protein